MIKRLLPAVMALALFFSLAACSSDSSQETSSTKPSENATTKPAPTTKPQEQPEFQETVLVDNDDLLFKITAITDDPIWGYTLKAHMENRTDKDLMFSLDAVSVNGFMCDPFFAATVTAGMKANKDISFSKDDFRAIGIKTVTDVTFTLKVYDSQDITDDPVLEEEFIIYPMGKENAREYPRQEQEGDIVLFENEDCAMIVTGFETGSIWGFQAQVYLMNKTDNTLMFSVGDAAINGFMCDPFFAQSVAPGKQCVTNISWTKDALAENGIEKVENITLPFRVYDTENWLEDAIVNETFTVIP